MRPFRIAYLLLATATLAAPAAANAAPLKVVTVSAPAINCVFNRRCIVTVNDSVGDIPVPGITGKARLQSRTFLGAPGAPAVGKTAYIYRVDLTQATAIGDFACVTDITIEFGPVTQLQYNKVGPLDDVFVITQGGLGTIGLASAEKTGNAITFFFSQPVCAASPPAKGQTSFFFGLASAAPPKAVTAIVSVPGVPTVDADARAPKF